MTEKQRTSVRPARGRLGVLTPGMGAVATTFFAGCEAVKLGLGLPVGSLTQMGTIRLGRRTEHRQPYIRDFAPLAQLKDLVFGGWDIFPEDAYQSARKAGVLDKELLQQLRPQLEAIRPMTAVFDPHFVRNLSGPNVKHGPRKLDLAEQLRADIRRFIRHHELDRCVMVWCASTESYLAPGPAHASLAAFEAALREDDHSIAPSMVYAYASLMEGVPFANGAPNLTVDISALQELAKRQRVPISGKDFKTGQTLVKTAIAPMLKARMLGLNGWFSTNILGNRDGEVLEDPGSFRSKEVSKLSVLDTILEPSLYPQLYGDFSHKVSINYYPPRGDNKEGWDNIDLFGWLGYPMQLKINFLCRDSILAAPIVLDVALFSDLAARAGMSGIQEWLSFYYKSPMAAPGLDPEHDLFIQQMKLKNNLRHLMGEELITHLGTEYYET
ncbi:MAG: inositol-3-phosphate synthase [Myxococcaceae bacterium]